MNNKKIYLNFFFFYLYLYIYIFFKKNFKKIKKIKIILIE